MNERRGVDGRDSSARDDDEQCPVGPSLVFPEGYPEEDITNHGTGKHAAANNLKQADEESLETEIEILPCSPKRGRVVRHEPVSREIKKAIDGSGQ
jgi:hypothetical protein